MAEKLAELRKKGGSGSGSLIGLVPEHSDYIKFTSAPSKGKLSNNQINLNAEEGLINTTNYSSANVSASWAGTFWGISSDGTPTFIASPTNPLDITNYSYMLLRTTGNRTFTFS